MCPIPRDRPAKIPIVASNPERWSLSESLPNQSIGDFIKIHRKEGDFSNQLNKDATQVKQKVKTMTKLEDLRTLLVKMITAWEL